MTIDEIRRALRNQWLFRDGVCLGQIWRIFEPGDYPFRMKEEFVLRMSGGVRDMDHLPVSRTLDLVRKGWCETEDGVRYERREGEKEKKERL